jgi:hypothetical protein
LTITRQADHHHVKPAGDSAGQPLNRVFERYTMLLDQAVYHIEHLRGISDAPAQAAVTAAAG